MEDQKSIQKVLSEILPQDLEKSIKTVADKQGFVNYELVVKNLSTAGGSYMGILYEVDIKGKTVEGDKEVNLFVKNIVDNQDMPIYSIPGVFATEHWVYNELEKVITELQNEANISVNERYKIPFAFEESSPKTLILEHLGKKGFKVYNRMEIIPIDYAEMCIKELAKFHALTFVIKEKRPYFFNEQIMNKAQPYNFGEDWYEFVKNMASYSISCLELNVQEKLKDVLVKKADEYPKYMCDTSGVSTLCHGDYKLNNVMVKETDGKVTEVIPIDYQILHYGCPLLDFIYFVFQGTDREFRKKHLAYLKDLYYGTMESFLQSFQIDIQKFFPRVEFEKLFKGKLDFGLMINVFYGPFLFAVEGDAPDVTTADLATISFKVDDRFTERFRDVVDDFIEWGYI